MAIHNTITHKPTSTSDSKLCDLSPLGKDWEKKASQCKKGDIIIMGGAWIKYTCDYSKSIIRMPYMEQHLRQSRYHDDFDAQQTLHTCSYIGFIRKKNY